MASEKSAFMSIEAPKNSASREISEELPSAPSSSRSPQHLFLDVSTELLECGHSVRFKAPGRSMQPIIKEGETITVEPIAPEAVKRGDIILYRTPGGVVAHRVVGIKREMTAQSSSLSPHHLFLLRGDASTTCDTPVAPHQVLGKVISVERDGRSINPYCLRVKTQRLARLIASRIKRWLLRLAEAQQHIDELTL
jgi:signal peptidase I